MGTTLRAEVAAPNRELALAAVQAAFDSVAVLESVLSTWRDDSEIERLNRARPGDGVAVSPTLARLLDEASRWAAATGGAFDPAVGALTDAWDLRGRGRVPAPAALARALAATGMAQFAMAGLDGPSATAARRSAAAWLDTGGFGKGAGLRAASTVLRRAGVVSASLNFGGQVALFGPGPASGAWVVPVADPGERLTAVAALQVRDASVSTSAQSERFVEIDGRRYGHILDPRTGRPVEAWGSVTVVASDAAVADMLSTALFVLGPVAGPRWASRHEVAALFLVRRPEGLEVRPTPAIRPLLVGQTFSPTGG